MRALGFSRQVTGDLDHVAMLFSSGTLPHEFDLLCFPEGRVLPFLGLQCLLLCVNPVMLWAWARPAQWPCVLEGAGHQGPGLLSVVWF